MNLFRADSAENDVMFSLWKTLDCKFWWFKEYLNSSQGSPSCKALDVQERISLRKKMHSLPSRHGNWTSGITAPDSHKKMFIKEILLENLLDVVRWGDTYNQSLVREQPERPSVSRTLHSYIPLPKYNFWYNVSEFKLQKYTGLDCVFEDASHLQIVLMTKCMQWSNIWDHWY